MSAQHRLPQMNLAHWSDYIDNEIAMLKSSVAQLEDDLHAVG